jgi:hypothetical protein
MRLEYMIEMTRSEIIQAKLSWDIFWVFSNNRDRPKYVKVLNNDLMFFSPSIGAHYRNAMVTIGKIFDGDLRAMGLPRIIRDAVDQGRLKADTHRKINAKLSRQSKLISKYSILRNNVVAHVSGKISREDAYKKANLRFNDFQKLLHLGFSILSQIKSDVSGESLHDWNLFSATRSTRKLLDKLQKIMEEEKMA